MLNSEIEAAIEEKRKDKLPYDHYKNLIKDKTGYCERSADDQFSDCNKPEKRISYFIYIF